MRPVRGASNHTSAFHAPRCGLRAPAVGKGRWLQRRGIGSRVRCDPLKEMQGVYPRLLRRRPPSLWENGSLVKSRNPR